MFHGNFCRPLCEQFWLEYSVVEVLLSAAANRFEMMCQSRTNFAVVTKSAFLARYDPSDND